MRGLVSSTRRFFEYLFRDISVIIMKFRVGNWELILMGHWNGGIRCDSSASRVVAF